MTAIKINGKPSATAGAALERYADQLYNNRTARLVAIVELKHGQRTEPADDEERDRTVELRMAGLEIASPEQDEDLRKAMRALYLHRTAQGTLDEEGDIEVARQTLRMVGERLADIEATNLRIGAQHWANYARTAFRAPDLSATELRHELEAVCLGLERVLDPGKEEK